LTLIFFWFIRDDPSHPRHPRHPRSINPKELIYIDEFANRVLGLPSG
jgi:hypothetical protein